MLGYAIVLVGFVYPRLIKRVAFSTFAWNSGIAGTASWRHCLDAWTGKNAEDIVSSDRQFRVVLVVELIRIVMNELLRFKAYVFEFSICDVDCENILSLYILKGSDYFSYVIW